MQRINKQLNKYVTKLYLHFSTNKRLRKIYGSNKFVRRLLKTLFPGVLRDNYGIEISSYCNAKCIFCSYPHLAKSKTNLVNMTDETFSKCIEHIRKSRKSVIVMCPRVGENLCNRNWSTYLQTLLNEEYVTIVSMFTNGILLDDKQLNILLNLENLQKLSMLISVGGVDANTYNFMYGINKFDKVKNNIISLLNELKARNLTIPVHIELRVPDLNQLNFEEAKDLFNPSKYKHFSVFAADQYDSLNDLSQGKDKGLKIVSNLRNKKIPCNRLKSLTFNSNGTIGACGCVSSIGIDNGDLILGHVDDDLSAINERREKMGLDWKNNKKIPKECQHCAFYDA